MSVGIAGLGIYIPRNRLLIAETAKVWKHEKADDFIQALQVDERAVTSPDEDVNTMAIMAAQDALTLAGIPAAGIDALYLGTRTSPYTARPSSTLLLEVLGIRNYAFTADLHNDDRSALSALQAGLCMIESGMAANALIIGSDTSAQYGSPGVLGEYLAAAGAGSLVITNSEEKIRLVIEKVVSRYCKPIAAIFEKYEQLFFARVSACVFESYLDICRLLSKEIIRELKSFFQETKTDPAQFSHVVFQQPNGYLPQLIGAGLGFRPEQLAAGLVVRETGDCGSASILIGLKSVFDAARTDEEILLVSFSKSGLDILILSTTAALLKDKERQKTARAVLQNKNLIGYATALKFEHKYLKVPYALSTFL